MTETDTQDVPSLVERPTEQDIRDATAILMQHGVNAPEQQLATAARAILEAMQSGARVRVRKLEWEEGSEPFHPEIWTAKSIFGEIDVWSDHDNPSAYRWGSDDFPALHNDDIFGSEQEAKAAAKAGVDALILASLEGTPQPGVSDAMVERLRVARDQWNADQDEAAFENLGAAIDQLVALTPDATNGGEPRHTEARRQILARAAEMDAGDFALEIEPHDDDARTVAIVTAAYDWTLDDEGRLYGLVAGDMGWAATNIVVEPSADATNDGAETDRVDDLVAADQCRTQLIARADVNPRPVGELVINPPMFYGWAIVEAFLEGAKYAREASTPTPSAQTTTLNGDVCDACNRIYTVIYRVPNDVWPLIAPKPETLGPYPEHQYGGCLCPDCASRRAEAKGIRLNFDGIVGQWGDPDAAEPVEFGYTNWRGEHAVRKAVPLRGERKESEWHGPGLHWVMVAFDLDKQAERDFLIKDIGPQSTPSAQPDAGDGVEVVGYVIPVIHPDYGHTGWHFMTRDMALPDAVPLVRKSDYTAVCRERDEAWKAAHNAVTSAVANWQQDRNSEEQAALAAAGKELADFLASEAPGDYLDIEWKTAQDAVAAEQEIKRLREALENWLANPTNVAMRADARRALNPSEDG